MKNKRIFIGIILLLSLLGCNFFNRVIFPSTSTPLPTQTPLPTETLTPTSTPLAPAYIPLDCRDKPIATVSAATALAEPTLESEADKPVSKDEQLTIFAKLTSIVEKVYVYPDFNGKNWEEIKSRYREQIEAGLDAASFYPAMQKMIAELGDEHSFYLSPVEAKKKDKELSGNLEYAGVGIYSLPIPDRQRVSVVLTFPDSPAAHSGLKPHDSILMVDGLPFSQDVSGLRMLGPKCSAVVLTVQSPGGAPYDVMLIRNSIKGGPPVESQLIPTGDGSKIGYIMIPTFFNETIPSQVDDALNNFGPLDGLILDLRFNSGGSSDVVQPILSRFESGTLGEFKSRKRSRPLTVKPNPIQNSQTVPLIVLVGEGTVSYGEVFSGVLKDSGRAKIVGQKSLGNVEVLHGYKIGNNSQLWIAEETFVPAISKDNWEATGIVPDVEAFADWDTFTFENDPSIAAAVKLLGH